MKERQAEIGVDDDVVTTVSGILVHFLDPHTNEIIIEDIAQGLSNICRFTGQVREHYSVAQHSLLVSWLVPQAPASIPLAALMHDSAEAYLGDLASPIKRLMPQFKAIETDLHRHICRLYGLSYDSSVMELIKHYDTVALVTEGRDLIKGWAHQTSFGVDPAPGQVMPVSPHEARRLFLIRFHDLSGRSCE